MIKEVIQGQIDILIKFTKYFGIDKEELHIDNLFNDLNKAKSIEELEKEAYILGLNAGTSIINMAGKPKFILYSNKDLEKCFNDSRIGLTSTEISFCKFKTFDDYLKNKI